MAENRSDIPPELLAEYTEAIILAAEDQCRYYGGQLEKPLVETQYIERLASTEWIGGDSSHVPSEALQALKCALSEADAMKRRALSDFFLLAIERPESHVPRVESVRGGVVNSSWRLSALLRWRGSDV